MFFFSACDFNVWHVVQLYPFFNDCFINQNGGKNGGTKGKNGGKNRYKLKHCRNSVFIIRGEMETLFRKYVKL